MSIFSKIFGGNKSEKDIKIIAPLVDEINKHFASYQSLSNDQLRAKTNEFKQRIKDYLLNIDTEISNLNKKAEELPFSDLTGKDVIYNEVDALKKERDKEIEKILKEILPEAFAVVKETENGLKKTQK